MSFFVIIAKNSSITFYLLVEIHFWMHTKFFWKDFRKILIFKRTHTIQPKISIEFKKLSVDLSQRKNNIQMFLSSFVYKCLWKWQHAGNLVERSCVFEPTDIYILNIIQKHCHYSCGTIAFPRENCSTANNITHTFRQAYRHNKVLKKTVGLCW